MSGSKTLGVGDVDPGRVEVAELQEVDETGL